jgi:hypothetical protein
MKRKPLRWGDGAPRNMGMETDANNGLGATGRILIRSRESKWKSWLEIPEVTYHDK